MGYRGKVVEQERARELRAEAWTLQEIADELGVAKSTVSKWVRGIEFTPKPRRNHNHGAREASGRTACANASSRRSPRWASSVAAASERSATVIC